MNELQVFNDPKAAVEASVLHGVISYEDYVEAGKRIVRGISCYQAILAYYTCQVCTIRHGGRSDKYYTVSDYARDIGIDRKTLQNWSLIYRNVIVKLDLDPTNLTKDEWRTASRVNDNMKWETRSRNRDSGTKKKQTNYKRDYPDHLVKQLFVEESEGPSFRSEVRAWMQYCRLMRNTMKKRELMLAPDNDLTELMEICDEVSDLINKHLTTKRKRK